MTALALIATGLVIWFLAGLVVALALGQILKDGDVETPPPPWVNDGHRPAARRQICRTTRHDYREECDA